MAEDSFTEVTEQSWFSRLLDSIKSVLFGIVLFLVAFPLLFWNEGRAVRTAKSLAEGASAVVSVASDTVNPANEAKLVHMTGEATTTETLSDPEFGISVPAIKLERRVEMYQWEEEKKSESRTKLGGGRETVTTYTYKQDWSPRLIDSSSFKKREGHENPRAMPVSSQSWTAKKVTLGAFTLSEAQVGSLNKFEAFSADETAAAALPPAMKKRAKLDNGGYYLGGDPASPAIGDTKVTFQIVRPATVSIVARQIGNTFEAYLAKAGGSILLLAYGTASADSMFKTAEETNVVITWVLRVGGFLLMALGLFLVLRPFVVLADVIPMLGTLLGVGIGLFVSVVAGSLTLVTIAVSWLFFRPLLGIILLVLAGGGITGLIYLGKQRRAKRQQQMPGAPAAAG
jgi:hypothetical protein